MCTWGAREEAEDAVVEMGCNEGLRERCGCGEGMIRTDHVAAEKEEELGFRSDLDFLGCWRDDLSFSKA